MNGVEYIGRARRDYYLEIRSGRPDNKVRDLRSRAHAGTHARGSCSIVFIKKRDGCQSNRKHALQSARVRPLFTGKPAVRMRDFYEPRYSRLVIDEGNTWLCKKKERGKEKG